MDPTCVLMPCPVNYDFDDLLQYSPPNCRCAIGYVNCSWVANTDWTRADLLYCPATFATTTLANNVPVVTKAFNTSTTVTCPAGFPQYPCSSRSNSFAVAKS